MRTYTFKELYEQNLHKELPESGGIYRILLPENFEFIIKPTTDAADGKHPKSVEKLINKWNKIGIHDDRIVYIGKADNLRRRIRQYTKHGYGEAKNHMGGRAIWQLENNKELLVEIEPCDANVDPEYIESMLLDEYILTHNNTLPFANFKKGKYSALRKKCSPSR